MNITVRSSPGAVKAVTSSSPKVNEHKEQMKVNKTANGAPKANDRLILS